MQRRCPDCGSTGVRRSHPGDLDEPATTLLRSRYYCRNCSKLFWVLRARTYRIGGIVLGLVLTLLGAVAVIVSAPDG
jgi:transposase-like protein